MILLTTYAIPVKNFIRIGAVVDSQLEGQSDIDKNDKTQFFKFW